MEYRELLEEIIELENSDFSIEMVNDAKRIFDVANNIYLGYKKYGINIENKYDLVKKRIEATLYNKIKAVVPDVNKNTLMNLIRSISGGYIKSIDDVLIMDRSIVLIGNDFDNDQRCYISSSEMIPINQCYSLFHHKFRRCLKNEDVNNYINLIVTSINNFVSLIIDNKGKTQCLKLEHNRIDYNVKNVELYVNISMENLLEMLKQNKAGVFKAILIHHDNQVCYLQIDIHQDFVVIKDIPGEAISLKNISAKGKSKVYRLIG